MHSSCYSTNVWYQIMIFFTEISDKNKQIIFSKYQYLDNLNPLRTLMEIDGFLFVLYGTNKIDVHLFTYFVLLYAGQIVPVMLVLRSKLSLIVLNLPLERSCTSYRRTLYVLFTYVRPLTNQSRS